MKHLSVECDGCGAVLRDKNGEKVCEWIPVTLISYIFPGYTNQRAVELQVDICSVSCGNTVLGKFASKCAADIDSVIGGSRSENVQTKETT